MQIFNRILSFLEKNPIISIILIGIPALLSLFYILIFGVNLVYWDQWELVPYLEKLFQNTLTITDLFSQHNEHRLFFPRIAMLAIAYLTHYNTIAEMLFGWAILLSASVILFFLFRKHFGISNNYLLLFIPIAWLFFSTKQYDNLLWGWQIQIFLCILGFLLSVYCLEKCEKLDLFFIIAIFGGILSTFSFFNGLLVWIAGIFYLLMKKKSKILLYSWIGATIIVYLIFFINWIRPEGYQSSSLNILKDPVEGIIYFIANAGSGLSGGTDTSHLLIIGILALIFGTITLFAILFGLYFNYRYKLFERNAAWWTLIIFSLMTSLILSLGRGGIGIYQSLSSHYVTFTILGIIGIYCILANLVRYLPRITLVKFVFTFFTILMILGIVLGNIEGFNQGYIVKTDRIDQADILLHYSNEQDLHLLKLYPDANRIRQDAPILEKANYNVFYG